MHYHLKRPLLALERNSQKDYRGCLFSQFSVRVLSCKDITPDKFQGSVFYNCLFHPGDDSIPEVFDALQRSGAILYLCHTTQDLEDLMDRKSKGEPVDLTFLSDDTTEGIRFVQRPIDFYRMHLTNEYVILYAPGDEYLLGDFRASYFGYAFLADVRFVGADFRDADFSKTYFGKKIYSQAVTFVNCDLRGTTWPDEVFDPDGENGLLYLETCLVDDERFRGEYEAHFLEPRAVYKRVHLKGFDLSNLDLSGSNFSRSTFGAERLSYMYRETPFLRKDLLKVFNSNFDDSILFGCNFSTACIDGSSFKNANLSRAITPWFQPIRNVDFTNASLKGAYLEGSIFEDCDFTGADLSDASYDDVTLKSLRPLLTDDQLASMVHIRDLPQTDHIRDLPETEWTWDPFLDQSLSFLLENRPNRYSEDDFASYHHQIVILEDED